MEHDLIIDVGANNGDDTAHYLAKGFRVVAVEANPLLSAELEQRFAGPIRDGRLTVLNTGVWFEAGVLDFYVNLTNDHWSSFVESDGTRTGNFRVEPIECVPFADILATHGVPYYLKIDIERADRCCIEALDPADLPMYTSIEAHSLDYLAILWNLGYRDFKVVDQSAHNRPKTLNNESVAGRVSGTIEGYRRRLSNRFLREHAVVPGSSGPFGEATPGEWRDWEAVAYDWLHFHRGHHDRGTLSRFGWFDFHVRRPDSAILIEGQPATDAARVQ